MYMMNLEKVSEHQQVKLLSVLHELCSFDPKYGQFPGSLPVSLSRNDLNYIRKHDAYSVCEKTDGVRYMMLITNGEMYIVDRLMNFYEVYSEVNFDRECVYDGELVISNDGSCWYYMIFDVFASYGRTVKDVANHKARIDNVSKIFPRKLNVGPYNLVINVKTFYYAYNFMNCSKQSFPYATDGYIFTPTRRKIFNGTDRRTYKWKDTYDHTIDFDLQEDGFLYLKDKNNKNIRVSELKYEESDRFIAPCIVECKLMKDSRGVSLWKFVKERVDKNRPNSMMTYLSTIKVIEEGITLQDLNNLSKY